MAAIRWRHITEFAFLALSTATFQGSRLGTALVAASLLAPAEFGIWGLVLAGLNYGVYANLGILSGANREIPRLWGAGRAREADEAESAALGATLACSALVLAIGCLLAVGTAGDQLPLVILTVAAISVQQIYLFYQTTLRSRLDFNQASVQQLALAIVFPLLGLPLLGTLGATGLVVGQLAAFGIGAALVYAMWRRQLRPSLNRDAARRLVAVGLPIMIAGLAFALLTTADRWLTLWLLGEGAVGAYTLAGLPASALLLVALVVAQQVYPRMAIRFGERGAAAAVWPIAAGQSALTCVLLLPLVAVIVALGPPAIEAWLPAYREAIPAVVLLPLAFLVLTATSGFTNLLVTVGRSGVYLTCLVAGLAVETVAALVLVRLGLGLTGIALAAGAGYATTAISATVAAFVIARSP